MGGGPYTFLRNEPTVFGERLLFIHFVFRSLCRLQGLFAGGFVLENEPTGGVFLMAYDRKVGGFGPLFQGSEGVFHCAGQGKGVAILL
jgi:hypothetical protein